MSAFEDMGDVLDLLGTGTYSARRRAPATYVEGVRVPGATTTFTITAAIQPLAGREIDRLPDGFRDNEAKDCFTTTELRTASEGAEPDEVLVDGKWHQVQSVKDWSDSGNFYRAVLVRPSA